MDYELVFWFGSVAVCVSSDSKPLDCKKFAGNENAKIAAVASYSSFVGWMRFEPRTRMMASYVLIRLISRMLVTDNSNNKMRYE